MKVLICHNCSGFGVTVGPVLRPVCAEPGDGEVDGEPTPTTLREEPVIYPCQACDGAGFFKIAAAS